MKLKAVELRLPNTNQQNQMYESNLEEAIN